MARLNWGVATERFFETGIDRGVLYTGDGVGVPWNGLTSVSESPTGGEAKPAYIDGYKFRNIASSEEYEATIEAFSSPKEFGPCDGSRAIHNGLIATQQPRQAFNFSYRTLVGNAVEGPELGYKIHLVYNALAGPAQRSNGTVSDSVEASRMSWGVTTLPPSLTGMKPTAHFIIDSRETPRGLLAAIEDILYGTEVNSARMPLVSELVTMFQSEGPLMRRNLVTNPTFRSTNGTGEIRRNYCNDPHGLDATKWGNYTGVNSVVSDASAAYSGSTGLLVTCGTTSSNPRISNVAANQPYTFAIGDQVTMQAKVRLAGTGWQPTASPFFILRGPLTAGGEWTSLGTQTTQALAGGWILKSITVTIPAGATGVLTINLGADNAGVLTTAAQLIHIDEIGVMKEGKLLPWFTGGTVADADTGWTYSWVGAVNLSASVWTAPLSTVGNLYPYAPIVGGRVGADVLRLYNKAIVFNLFGFQGSANIIAQAGEYYAARMEMRSVCGADLKVGPRLGEYGGVFVRNPTDGTKFVDLLADGEWVPVSLPSLLPITTNANTVRMMLYTAQTGGWANVPAGHVLEIRRVIIEKVDGPGVEAGEYFDGSTLDQNANFYSWESVADASVSRYNSWN